MNILLFNQYAGNKGDRAVLYALCNMILEIQPTASVFVSTSNPQMYDGYTFYQKHGIQFLPASWDYTNVKTCQLYWRTLNKVKKYAFTILREAFLRDKCKWLTFFLVNPVFRKAVKNADYIISVGGHHYCTLLSRDLVSTINFDAFAVKLLNKSFTCFSQTFGPFSFYKKKNEIATRKILNCSTLYLREYNSFKALTEFGISPKNLHLTYETVFSLSRQFSGYTIPSSRSPKVGISIYCTQKRNEFEEKNYIDSIAELCNHVISSGYEILFFPMEMKGTPPDDRPFIRQIIKKVKFKNDCRILDEDLETAVHLQEISQCQMFIGHKTHSAIFAITTGTPLLAIAYHPKVIEFMRQFDMDEYVIEDTKLDSDILISNFEKLKTDMDPIGRKEIEKSLDYATKLNLDLSEIVR